MQDEPPPPEVTGGIDEYVIEALTAAGLPVPPRERVDQDGYTPEESAAIRRYLTGRGDRRRIIPAGHPDRVAGDIGYREAAEAGHAISQRPTPGDVARIRAALMGDIPARVGLTEQQLRAFARGEMDRMDLPRDAQQRFRELADTLGGRTFWPRKVAVILWGMHVEQKRSVPATLTGCRA